MSNVDWGKVLPALLAAAPGLVGSGLGLANLATVAGRQDTEYGQGQAQYQERLQLARQYQQLIDQYQQQQQQQFGQRNQIAGRLADPAQVSSGAQQFFNPYFQNTEDEALKVLRRDEAARGITPDSGVDRAATVDRMAPLSATMYQQALQNFLQSQGQAISGYGPAPEPPAPAQYPGVPSYIPGEGNTAKDTLSSVSDQLANLFKSLGLGGDDQTTKLLKQLLGGGSNTGLNNLGAATGEGDPYGSTIPGMSNNPQMIRDYQSMIDQIGSGGSSSIGETMPDYLGIVE